MIKSGNVDEAVQQLAVEKLDHLKKHLDKLKNDSILSSNQGEVGVAAAIVGMSKQLSKLIEEDNCEELEEAMERWESIEVPSCEHNSNPNPNPNPNPNWRLFRASEGSTSRLKLTSPALKPT